MSGRSVASTLVLLGVCLSVSGVCQADLAPSPIDPTKSDDPQALPEAEIRLLTIKTIVSTLVSTVSHTVMVYPTCTTTAESGVSACAGGDPLPARLTSASTTVPATPTPHVSGVSDAPSTIANVMEVVLPSCDCGEGGKSSRTPRFLGSEDVITLKTTTTLTVDKVLTAIAPTIVSLTYNGCVPADAISTTPCLAPTTSTTPAETS